MKTKEELNALKEEVETLNQKLAELTDEDLAQISAGYDTPIMPTPDTPYRPHFGDTFRCVECWYEIYDITPTTCLPGICPGCGSTAGWEPAE